LFPPSGWVRGHVNPHLQDICYWDAFAHYHGAENSFRVDRYSHHYIGGAAGVIDRETKAVQ
jgi:hypothetical protein